MELEYTKVGDYYIPNLIAPNMKDFKIGKYGRMSYLRPIYSAWYKRDKESALKTLDKYRSFYHSTAVKYIELDLKAIG